MSITTRAGRRPNPTRPPQPPRSYSSRSSRGMTSSQIAMGAPSSARNLDGPERPEPEAQRHDLEPLDPGTHEVDEAGVHDRDERHLVRHELVGLLEQGGPPGPVG